MRKKLVGGVATVALVATFSGEASAASHEVKPGDSLWKIANQYKTTVTKIKELNNLSSDIIYPKQVIKLNGSAASGSNSASASAASSNNKSGSSTSAKTGSTYTVKSGDYLIKIANLHNISLAQLKQWNGLSSDMIRPGQVLKVSSGGGNKSSAAPVPTKPQASASASNNSSGGNSSSSTYKVVSGDTLGRIAARYGTSVSQLKQANGLSSDLIFVGQVLKLNGSAKPANNNVSAKQNISTAEKQQVSAAPSSGSNVIQTAKQVLGSKYAWGGTSPAGFDCSGFIYYAFKQAGHNVSRTSTDGYYNRSYYVNSPQPGDLVFFKNTYKSGISHMGIFLGGGQFIHAGNDGVEITSLSNSYWKGKFDGYKRFY